MRRALVAKHNRERLKGLDASAEVHFCASGYNALVKFVRMFLQSLALGAGAWLAVNGHISVGAITHSAPALDLSLLLDAG